MFEQAQQTSVHLVPQHHRRQKFTSRSVEPFANRQADRHVVARMTPQPLAVIGIGGQIVVEVQRPDQQTVGENGVFHRGASATLKDRAGSRLPKIVEN